MRPTDQLALYTTVYPSVRQFLNQWYDSVLSQTDKNFDIWIGLDAIEPDEIKEILGQDLEAFWVPAEKGDSPAQVRGRALEKIVKQYPAVVLVDSDDLLEPTRLEGARVSLEKNDIVACAMRIIDSEGKDTGFVFGPPEGTDLRKLLVRNNVFGLSNSAYRSEILEKCFPIPPESLAVDWYLVTNARALNARLHFDFTIRMAYRQYSENTAKVLPPFTENQIKQATELVLNHYKVALTHIAELPPDQRRALENAQHRVEAFYIALKNNTDVFKRYVQALNSQPISKMWWAMVSNSQLEHIFLS